MPAFPWASGSLSAAEHADLSLSADDQTAMLAFMERLVQTPSHSTQEGRVAQLIVDELVSIGVSDVTVDRTGNVIARLGTGNRPILLYDAHMDTVQPASAGWLYDPYSAEIREGVLYGLGACDMKGSIAALVYGIKRLIDKAVPLSGTLMLAFVVQ